MWIAIEGSTCSGKSTLEGHVAKLLEKVDAPVEKVHMDRPAELTRRWVLNEYVLKWENQLAKGSNLLADRWHWGEPVYGAIYRPDTNKDGFGLLGVAGWRWTELFLQSRGAVTVFLRADEDTLKSRYRSRGDDHVTNADELMRVAKLYDQTYPCTGSTIVQLDTTVTNSEKTQKFARHVLDVASMRDLEIAETSKWRGYIGHHRPRALLVGDRRNITKRYGDETKLPFMPVDGNSGDYLMRALPDDLWQSVGIVNSEEYPLSITDLWDTLNCPPVVALGNNAAAALKARGIQFAQVHHPQYARRFAHHDIEKYGLSIRRAIEAQES